MRLPYTYNYKGLVDAKYENEINELPIMFKHKTNKDELDNLKVAISENTHEFDWNSHFDKFQLKLRELIMSKIPK